MKVIVRASGINLWIPCPVGLASFVVRRLPQALFLNMQKYIPAPYKCLATREVLCVLAEQCIDAIKENKGLEAVHVEARDGTYVSITF